MAMLKNRFIGFRRIDRNIRGNSTTLAMNLEVTVFQEWHLYGLLLKFITRRRILCFWISRAESYCCDFALKLYFSRHRLEDGAKCNSQKSEVL